MVSSDKAAAGVVVEPVKDEAKKAAESGPIDGVGDFFGGIIKVVGCIAEGIGDAISSFDFDL